MIFAQHVKRKLFLLLSLSLLLTFTACHKDNAFKDEVNLLSDVKTSAKVQAPHTLNTLQAEGMNILTWSPVENATEYRILVEQDGVETEYISGKHAIALPLNNNSKQHIRIQAISGETVSAFFRPEKTEAEDCSQTHWGYEGAAGPENWTHLCSGFSDCGGETQSPINISGAVSGASLRLAELLPSYNPAATDIHNNGHTVQFDYNAEGYLNVSGKDYQLLQFHFHAGSEHTVNGRRFPLEAHLVHKSQKGDLAVVSLLFEEGKDNFFLAKFLPNLPEQEGDEVHKTMEYDVTELFPDKKDYVTYQGSLTTPPCSEIVTWLVMTEPLQANKEQLAYMSGILQDNYRPVQDLNGRVISAYTPSH